jgi:hypothetical protein
MTAQPYVTDSQGRTFEVRDVTEDGKLVIAVASWTATVDPASYRLATDAEITLAQPVSEITARLRGLSNPSHTATR